LRDLERKRGPLTLRIVDRTWPIVVRLMKLHTGVYLLTRGLVGHKLPWLPPNLLLQHVGARTGKRRISPLLYFEDGPNLILVASKGGYPKHPSWFHNLMANPDTVVQVGSRRLPVHARVATPEERARLWPMVVKPYPHYATYQQRTARQIPLVILEPRATTPVT
jgi:deazaflavin-dependent oxidoreductase (nitroreductase family)